MGTNQWFFRNRLNYLKSPGYKCVFPEVKNVGHVHYHRETLLSLEIYFSLFCLTMLNIYILCLKNSNAIVVHRQQILRFLIYSRNVVVYMVSMWVSSCIVCITGIINMLRTKY